MQLCQCVCVYCWQMLFVRYPLCDPTCRGCGSAMANARETLSAVCAVPVHATHSSPRVLSSVPHCVIARLLKLNEDSFHLFPPSTALGVLLLPHWLAISVDFYLMELLCSHVLSSSVAGLTFICSKKLL